MSATITSAPATTSITNCGALLYDIPVVAPACALPFGGNHTDILEACCKDASIVAYRDNCGMYCAALGQSADDLIRCFRSQGAGDAAPFCNVVSSAVSESATADPSVPTTAAASAIGGKGSDKDDDKETASGSDKATQSGSATGSKASNTDNAAPGVKSPSTVSTFGLVIGALLFSATTFGALQI